MTEQIIPRREPEVVEAEAKRRWFGDDEKVATTSLKSLTVRGIELTSRYDKAHEYELMQRMVLKLPADSVNAIVSIFCDSKATNTYTVVLRNWDAKTAGKVGAQLEATLLNMKSGHNGIWVECSMRVPGDTERLVIIDPNWGEEF
jgi:hypothetical protein